MRSRNGRRVTRTTLGVTVYGVDFPALLWSLRNHDLTVPLALDPASSPELIITPPQEDLGLAAAYRGQDFAWRQTPVWDSMPVYFLRWFLFHELPASSETLVLWVRNDLFIDFRIRSSRRSLQADHMKPPSIIAIDGPAASGKSTIGKRLADELGYLFFDTGVMYRAVTWIALQRGVDVGDEDEVTRLAVETPIDVAPLSKMDGRACDVLVDGNDITWEVRRPEVDANVSVVSAYPGVRQALSQQQRRIGQRGRVVMVGRDIGTVVLPEADLKIYLDASAEERAHRRFDEIIARGEKADFDEILSKVRERDRIDSTRAVAPLRPAQDAIIIDSDKMSADQVLARVKELCHG